MARVPAAILSHGSSGRHPAEAEYVRFLNRLGIAVLALDHFEARGIRSTVADQSQVSNTAMARDVLAAADVLARDPRITPERIAVIGFSKGGGAAMLAAQRRIAGRRTEYPPLRLHVAYYPWCGNLPRDMRTTGGAILLLMGEADTYVSVPVCREWAAATRAQGGTVDELVFPGAAHGFDGVGRAWSNPRGENAAGCVYEEKAGGMWQERSSDLLFRPGSPEHRQAERSCMRLGVAGGPQPEARRSAFAALEDAVRRHLLAP
jgi:dienelactone hydrolase